METHGSWDTVRADGDDDYIVPNDRPEWLPLLLDRENSMYQRDKNHPSILIWSCGNEPTVEKIFTKCHSFSARRIRPGWYIMKVYLTTADIMIRATWKVRCILRWRKSKNFLQKTGASRLSAVNIHAMGNSCGAMHKYTDLTDTDPLYQGGFIWDYIDQTIYKKDRYGQEFQAYGGDFGRDGRRIISARTASSMEETESRPRRCRK